MTTTDARSVWGKSPLGSKRKRTGAFELNSESFVTWSTAGVGSELTQEYHSKTQFPTIKMNPNIDWCS